MDPLDETPTSPADYAALTAGYSTLLGALLVASRDRGDEPVHPGEIVPLGIATFALAKLVAKEKVETWVRRPFVHDDEEGRPPKGRGLRYAVGELMSCTRCIGAWSALGVVGLRVLRPREGRVVTAVLGASALNDWLQAGFTELTARTNEQQVAAETARERFSRAAVG